jgi:hypothetical protein
MSEAPTKNREISEREQGTIDVLPPLPNNMQNDFTKKLRKPKKRLKAAIPLRARRISLSSIHSSKTMK